VIHKMRFAVNIEVRMRWQSNRTSTRKPDMGGEGGGGLRSAPVSYNPTWGLIAHLVQHGTLRNIIRPTPGQSSPLRIGPFATSPDRTELEGLQAEIQNSTTVVKREYNQQSGAQAFLLAILSSLTFGFSFF